MKVFLKKLERLFEKRNEAPDSAYYVFINILSVLEDVRPAFLLQYIDYGEKRLDRPFTNSILELIKKYFPVLIQSENYSHNQGVLISKISYDGEKYIGNEEMGKILGYPCYKDFDEVCDNKVGSYTVHITAKFKKQKVKIITNRCKTIDKYDEYVSISSRIEALLKKYQKIFGSKVRVTPKFEKHILTQDLIDKLADGRKFTKREKEHIINILYNFGFSEEMMDYFGEGKFQYRNETHKGILMNLLICEKCEMYFFADEVVKDWEDGLMDTLEKTKK